ncbi:MAG: SH3 domain-containing protein [Rickettsiales bacterium]|jgi:SH3-like domain-containing protein|nr:SH3 domain-containing protein [Rickettsiales bacterium]
MTPRTRVLASILLLLGSTGGCEKKNSETAGEERKENFVALRSEETNLRAGPGKDFPIIYVYRLKHMPLRVLGEYDKWLRVVDRDGDSGWIGESLSIKIRTVLTQRTEQFLYKNSDSIAYPTHRVGKNVIGRLVKCKKHRCKVKIGKVTGWLDRSDIWGQDN